MKAEKFIIWLIRIAAIGFVVYIVLTILFTTLSSPDVISSVTNNCEIVHNIEANHKKFLVDGIYWEGYRNGTLKNFGLNVTSFYDDDEQWNGEWIVTEDFIREYVQRYSAEEFFDFYESFISNIVYRGAINKHLSMLLVDTIDYGEYYKNKKDLFRKASDTAELLFEMADCFEVHTCSPNPDKDKVISQKSETEPVTGKFNVGADNHIETRSSTITTDTYQYDDYTVIHTHGDEYYSGTYDWYNGKFIDVLPSFKRVDYYLLKVNGLTFEFDDYKSLSNFEYRWIVINGQSYYERKIYGYGFKYEGAEHLTDFDYPIYILTVRTNEIDESYIMF